ncbi:MAG TPA: Twin-arginine translocation pathway signal [Gammaproteobacteria bacterium]
MALAMQKVGADKAIDIVRHYELEKESRALLTEDQRPSEFLDTLIKNELYYDAVTFLAHSLPAREAVWWACVCCRYFLEGSDVKYQLALNAAEAWVYDPSEQNRRIAEKFAEEGDYATSASWAAAAAFWSGGSITKENDPAMEPPAFLYAHAVAGSVVMAAGWKQPEADEVKQRFETYLKHGISIANGGNG